MSFPKYEAYKDSGVEWLGVVPEHWDVAPLKHLVSIPVTDGPHETPNFIDDGVLFISAEAVSSGKIDFTKSKYISREDHNRFSKKYKPQKHDIYMVKSGATTGITAIIETDDEFSIWSPLAVIRCSQNHHPYFVLFSMRSRSFQESVVLHWSFGTQQNIGMSVIENLPIAYPPHNEQIQIARFLDHETARIDALIAEQQRLIELQKEKRQAVISHAVTKGCDRTAPMKDSGVEWLGEVPAHWTIGRVKNVASFITSGPRGWSDYIDEAATDIFLQSGDLDDQLNVNFKNAKRINAPEGAEGVRTRICGGDVLVCITGANTGRVAVINAVNETAYVNQHLGLIRPITSKCYSRYLAYSLASVACQTYFGVEQYGLKVGLSLTDLAEAPLALPPLSEQIQLVLQIESEIVKLDTLETEVDITVTLLQERRSALISAAVTGKIDVRGWQPPASAAPAAPRSVACG